MYSEAHQRAIRGHSEGPHARQRTWDSSSTTSTSCPESSPPTSRCLMREAIRGSSVAIAVRQSASEVRQSAQQAVGRWATRGSPTGVAVGKLWRGGLWRGGRAGAVLGVSVGPTKRPFRLPSRACARSARRSVRCPVRRRALRARRRERLGWRRLPDDGGNQRSSEAISGNQRSSEAIGGNQWSSEAIGGNQRSSVVVSVHQSPSAFIRGHQWSSVVISGDQWQSEVIRGHQKPTCTTPMLSVRSIRGRGNGAGCASN